MANKWSKQINFVFKTIIVVFKPVLFFWLNNENKSFFTNWIVQEFILEKVKGLDKVLARIELFHIYVRQSFQNMQDLAIF